jgi:hypothetical protein
MNPPRRLSYVKSFRDLEVYRRQRTLACEVFTLGSMMRKAESFASNDYTLREEPPPYLAEDAVESEY